MSASLQENKDLVVRLQRYLRKHTVYKDVEVKDYMINKHGSIKITYDLAGKEQMQKTITNSESQIDIHTLKKGLYLMKVYYPLDLDNGCREL